MASEAGAFWLREPGAGEIRTVPLPTPGPGEVTGIRGWNGGKRRRKSEAHEDWPPRVRKLSRDGKVTTIVDLSAAKLRQD